jgi:protein-L-isoaspartate(D-aspartate) O-methyltransferase
MAKKSDIFAENWDSKANLIERLKEQTSVLKNPRIEAAFKAIDRKDFVQPGYQVEAYEDYAIPIGEEQTISQPTTVAYMLELLAAEESDSVLDVGCGSGWSTALLAEIVGPGGQVVGFEVREDLLQFGQANIGKYELPQAEIRLGNPLKEVPSEAPFSRILVSAAAGQVPDALLGQLAVGGRMVIPIDDSLVTVMKKSEQKTETEEVSGFRFVPLQT